MAPKCSPPPVLSALYIWGYNKSGQIAALNVRRCVRVPKRLASNLFDDVGDARIVEVACGLQHTAAVASDGSLFTWGSNEFGQLGDGTEDDRTEPRRVEALENVLVKSVACGANCTAAICQPCITSKEDDSPASKLWVWGQNQESNFPQIFYGVFSPTIAVIQVACGAAHIAALSELGTIQSWGYNEYGQLGRGFSCEGRQEARLVDKFVSILDEPPEKVQISQIACGDYHTAAISSTGDVYTWGLGHTGQLGHRALQSHNREVLPRRVVSLEGVRVTHIACGGVHTCAVTESGALYTWGGGHAGQLGLGSEADTFSCYSNDVSAFARRVPVILVPNGVQHVTCGQCHTLAAMKDGRLLGWGYNSCGQAATGKSSYAWYPTPIDWCVGDVRMLAAGGGHSAVLTQACNLKELCELKIADLVTPENAPRIKDIALRNHSDALARFCGLVRDHAATGGKEYD
ncbi:hypothetical protein L7F22_000208 [Adiantum nelumboides]|nr:hypothetical protein [Adiantum nelumboides]